MLILVNVQKSQARVLAADRVTNAAIIAIKMHFGPGFLRAMIC